MPIQVYPDVGTVCFPKGKSTKLYDYWIEIGVIAITESEIKTLNLEQNEGIYK